MSTGTENKAPKAATEKKEKKGTRLLLKNRELTGAVIGTDGSLLVTYNRNIPAVGTLQVAELSPKWAESSDKAIKFGKDEVGLLLALKGAKINAEAGTASNETGSFSLGSFEAVESFDYAAYSALKKEDRKYNGIPILKVHTA